MAHNLFNERFFSNRIPAWHGLGTIGEEDKTATEIFNSMQPYVITLEPVYTRIQKQYYELPNRVITRHPVPDDPDYRSFGIVGPDYTIVDPLRTCEIWDESTQRPVETLGVLGKGESLFITTKLQSFSVQGTHRNSYTDDIDSYLLLHNPYGDGAVQVRVTPIRVVCQNTLIAARAASTESFKIIHDRYVEDNLAAWMTGIIDRAEGKSKALNDAFNLMASCTIDEEQAEDVLKRIYVDPRKPSYVPDKSKMEIREKAYEATVKSNESWRLAVMEAWGGLGTGMDSDITQDKAWGVYNAVVEVEDYRPTTADDSRSYNALFGDRANRKERAYDQLFQFATENVS